MTPLDAILELLARLGGSNGGAILVSEEELSRWPAVAVKAMKSQKLLVKVRSTASVVCPGCEQELSNPWGDFACTMRFLTKLLQHFL